MSNAAAKTSKAKANDVQPESKETGKSLPKGDASKSLFYTKPIVINSVTHRDVKLAPSKNYAFACSLNSSILVGTELMEAAKSYPTVFINLGQDSIMPVAILGWENNLFVNEQGDWQEGAYIPAFVRRYPFILAEGVTKDGSLAVCVDAACSGYDAEKGERMFDDEGNKTKFLENALKFIESYQSQYALTRVFVNFLKEHDLFRSIDANIKLADGKQFTMRNLLVIDEEKLKNLADEHLLLLVKRGFMAWIYAHMFSVSNFAKVINKK